MTMRRCGLAKKASAQVLEVRTMISFANMPQGLGITDFFCYGNTCHRKKTFMLLDIFISDNEILVNT
jgi:hypothetical protein